MAIYEYSPFFNEHRALQIKLREAAKWIDEVHLCEADRTYSHADKPMNFRLDGACGVLPAGLVHYHHFATQGAFRAPPAQQTYYDPKRNGREGFDAWYWALLCGNAAYHNEAVQRNRVVHLLKDRVEDDDIVILSDLDEMLDSRHAGQILDEVRRRGIVTVKLHYSVFYLNLFAATNHGMPDFSYRLFVMTGRYFRTLPVSPDYLRKRGIEGGLANEIHCLPQHAGFHHSWLDHAHTALPKLQAFQANVADQGMISSAYIEKCLAERQLHYLDAPLYLDNGKPFLGAVQDVDTQGLWLGEAAA